MESSLCSTNREEIIKKSILFLLNFILCQKNQKDDDHSYFFYLQQLSKE
jgi:hypothetical protein